MGICCIVVGILFVDYVNKGEVLVMFDEIMVLGGDFGVLDV